MRDILSAYAGKTVLITGATGLIGSRLTEAFLKAGNVKVIALCRNESKLQKMFSQFIDKENFSWRIQDCAKEIRPFECALDFIFHAAGQIAAKTIRESPLDIIGPNLYGTRNCLELLRTQQTHTGHAGRIVLFSSGSVYGNQTTHDITVRESDTAMLGTLNDSNAPYSQSKRMMEVMAYAYRSQLDIDAVVARISYVYGCAEVTPDTAFFEFVRKAIAGEQITIQNASGARRDWISAEDVVSALLFLGIKGEAGRAYNVSSNGERGHFAGMDEIAKIIVNIANKEHMISGAKQTATIVLPQNSAAVRDGGMMMDNSELKKLGWSLGVSMEEGLARTMRQFAAQL